MSDDDIVAELERWLAAWTLPGAPKAQLMDALQRARDEINALRAQVAEMSVPVIDANSRLRDEVDLLTTIVERIDALAAQADGPWAQAVRVRCAEALGRPVP